MPTHGGARGSRGKRSNLEIKNANPLPLVSGENSLRESSVRNNTTNGRADSDVPARGSGGPRTERGKKKLSRNAIKHGIFSSVVLPNESPKMYRVMFRALCDYFEAKECVERMIVEELATILWRKRRLILAESADVVYTSERAKMEMKLAGCRDLRNRQNNGRLMADDAHSNSLERAVELLYKLRALIQERGFDIDEDVMTLFQLFGPVEEGLPGDAQMIYAYWQKYSEVKTENRQPWDGISLEEAKKHAIDMIDGQIKLAQSRLECLKPFEIVRATFSLPSEIVLEKIMHYEGHLSREFDRTLQRLERVRRIKTGQSTPAPIEVKLST
jgi:hypothetical protein